MTPALVLNVEFFLSFVVWSIVLARYWVPRACASLDEGLLVVALVHGMRHIGLVYLQPAAISPALPDAFAVPTAYGDLSTSILAVCAAVLLWRGLPGRHLLAWAFTIVGFVDLNLAVFHALEIRYVDHHPGVGYLLPAIVVPGLLASHLFTAWALVRLRAR